MANGTARLLHLMAALGIAAVGVALISQYVFNLQPCAWCVLQRLVYLSIAVSCWIALLLGRMPLLRGAATLIAVLLSLGGIAAAWYQYSVASHQFSCELTFADRFMVGSGLDANVPWIFGIFASCMDAKVAILGLDYAIWSLILFAVIAVLGVAALLRRS